MNIDDTRSGRSGMSAGSLNLALNGYFVWVKINAYRTDTTKMNHHRIVDRTAFVISDVTTKPNNISY